MNNLSLTKSQVVDFQKTVLSQGSYSIVKCRGVPTRNHIMCCFRK